MKPPFPRTHHTNANAVFDAIVELDPHLTPRERAELEKFYRLTHNATTHSEGRNGRTYERHNALTTPARLRLRDIIHNVRLRIRNTEASRKGAKAQSPAPLTSDL